MSALNPADWNMVLAVVALFGMAALDTYQLVQTGIRWETYGIVLETGEHTRERKAENRKNGAVAAIYWGVALVLYLALSFLTGAWDRTWILWPIAGISYGILVSILRVVRKRA